MLPNGAWRKADEQQIEEERGHDKEAEDLKPDSAKSAVAHEMQNSETANIQGRTCPFAFTLSCGPSSISRRGRSGFTRREGTVYINRDERG